MMLVSLAIFLLLLAPLYGLESISASCQYDSLVFSGGGVKGAVYGGALMALEEAGVLQNAKNFAGTSAGSTIAALMAVGYTACELRAELEELSFDQLVEYSLPKAIKEAIFGKGTRKLLKQFDMKKGFFHGKSYETLIDKLVAKKLCSVHFQSAMELITDDDLSENGICWDWRNFTFGDLRDVTRKPPYDFERNLALTGFDITNGTLAYFNADSSPDMPISLAVRASSSLPLIFEPIEWKKHLYMDGGLLLGFQGMFEESTGILRRIPVDAFEHRKNHSMLAFKLGKDFIPTTPDELQHMRIGQFTYRVMHTLVRLRQDLDLVSRTKSLENVEWVNFEGEKNVSRVSPINFDVSDYLKAGMVNAGYSLIRERFQNMSCPQVKFISCAPITCYDDIQDRDGRNCSWIQDMYETAMIRDSLRELDWDIFLSTRIVGAIVFVVTLSVTCTSIRNQCHMFIMEGLAYHGTDRCEYCYRKWVPHELALHELKQLSNDEVVRALMVRGMKSDGKPERLKSRLKAAAYVENISLRRPWTLLQAFLPERAGNMCRDFPIKWMSIVVLLLAWLFYHRSTVMVAL